MTDVIDEELLDDVDRLAAADPGEMLREVAGSGAQLRKAVFDASEVDLAAAIDGGRPRAVVVAGMGGSGIAGDVLAAVAGANCPVPVVTHRGYGLPGWVGPADLVVGVSFSGTTAETLSAVEEAVRRGARLVTVGAAGSAIAQYAEQAAAPHIPVPGGRLPRAALWSLAAPVLAVGEALGLAHTPPAALEAAADVLDEITDRCRADKEAFLNPAKSLAIELATGVPVCWGSTALAGVAAYRFATQLAENANAPAVWGVLPEANHNQVCWYDGPAASDVRLVLLRDGDEQEHQARRAEASVEVARDRAVAVTMLQSEGATPVARLASLVALVDFTSVYLALLTGQDPSAMRPIDDLKARMAE